MQLVAGQHIGPYRLVDEAGSGGMAVVWRAFHDRLGRYVAIKFVSPQYSADPQYLGRFEREAQAISRLDHPNILAVYDYGEVDGWTYMVSPFVGSGTLATRLNRGAWSVEDAVIVLAPLASALDYAHAEGIVHRDVKPSNILFTDRGRPVLADFGIARILEASTLLSHAGLVIGTPMYMSPEQADGQPSGPSSDLYSLGVVAYEMLTGRPPFSAETPLALLRAHIDKPLPPPRSVNSEIPEAVEAALFRILAKDPEARFEHGMDLIRALQGAWPINNIATSQSQGDTATVPGAAQHRVAELALDHKSIGQSGSHGRRMLVHAPSSLFLFRLAIGALITVGLLTFLWPTSFLILLVPQPTLPPTLPTALVPPTTFSPTEAAPTPSPLPGPRYPPGDSSAGLAPTEDTSTPIPTTWRIYGNPSGGWVYDDQGRVAGRTVDGASLVLFPEVVEDVTYSALVNTSSCQATLVFRAQDDENLLMAIYIPDGIPNPGTAGGGIWLYQRVEGLDIPIKAVRPSTVKPAGLPVRLKIVTSGPQITVSLDDEPALQAVDTAPRSGKLGLMLYSSNGRQCEATFGDLSWVPLTSQPRTSESPTPARQVSIPYAATPPTTVTPLVPGLIVAVRGTGGGGARLRAQPGSAGSVIAVIPEYTPLIVIGQDRIVDGIAWRNVRVPSGAEGWIAAAFVTTG